MKYLLEWVGEALRERDEVREIRLDTDMRVAGHSTSER